MATSAPDPYDALLAALLRVSGGRQLLTVAEAAEALRVTRGWLYANKARLGAVALGDGPKAPIRIDAAVLAFRLTQASSDASSEVASRPTRSRSRRPSQQASGNGLLPVRDRFAGATPRKAA